MKANTCSFNIHDNASHDRKGIYRILVNLLTHNWVFHAYPNYSNPRPKKLHIQKLTRCVPLSKSQNHVIFKYQMRKIIPDKKIEESKIFMSFSYDGTL